MSRAIEVAVNVARVVGGAAEAVARALRLGAARLAATPSRSARLIGPLTDPAADGAHRARVLAPAVRRLHRAPGHRSGGLDEPDIRAAGDTKDAAAAKASARDLQDGLAVDKERAAALLTGDVARLPLIFRSSRRRRRIRIRRVKDRATYVAATNMARAMNATVRPLIPAPIP